METIYEVAKEYGMEFIWQFEDKTYQEVLEYKVELLKRKKGVNFDSNKDFRKAIELMFTMSCLKIVDVQKFTDIFKIKFENQKLYPKWFTDTIDIRLGYDQERTYWRAIPNNHSMNTLQKELLKKEPEEKDFLDKVTGTNTLERTFLKDEISTKMNKGLNYQQAKFCQEMFVKGQVDGPRLRIIKALRMECQHVL